MSEKLKSNLTLFGLVIGVVLVVDVLKSQLAKRKITQPLEVKPE